MSLLNILTVIIKVSHLLFISTVEFQIIIIIIIIIIIVIRDLKIPRFRSTGTGKLPVAVHVIGGGKFNLSYRVLSLEVNIAGLVLSLNMAAAKARFVVSFFISIFSFFS